MQRPTLTFRNESAADTFVSGLEPTASVVAEPFHDTNLYVVTTDIPSMDAVLNAAGNIDTSDLVICPSCHSKNVEYPEKPENSPSMKAVHKMVEKMTPGDGKQFHCNHCENAWSE